MRIRDLSLRAKVFGALGLILSIQIAAGIAVHFILGLVDGEAGRIRDTWLPGVETVGELMSEVERYRILEGRALLTQDEAERLQLEELLWNARDRVFRLRTDYQKLRVHDGGADRMMDDFDVAWLTYQKASREMIGLIFGEHPELALARQLYNGEGELRFRAARTLLMTHLAEVTDAGRRAADKSKLAYSLTNLLMAGVVIAAAVLSWLSGAFILLGVTRPVAMLTGVIRRLAEDDLTVAVPDGGRSGEIGVMAAGLAELRRRLIERHRLIEEDKENLRKLQVAERELVETERLAALGRMVAGISHEINTPLGSAYTVATTLVDHHHEFAYLAADSRLRKSDLESFVERVGRAAEVLTMTLGKAIDLIRNFKQVAVDQTSAARRRFDLGDVVRQVVTTLSPMFKRLPHRIETEIDGPIAMDSFPGPLGQVLSNLIDNAVIHGLADSAAGRVLIRARQTDGDHVVIEVVDDGAGIAAEAMSHLFEPFFTTRFGQGGSGLGLNIVHGIVAHVLGGTVEVRSRPGEGTTFSLSLPLVAPVAAVDGPARAGA